VTRGLNVVFVVAPDWTRLSSVLSPAIERVEVGAPGPQVVVVVPDAEAAVAAAGAAGALGRPHGLSAVAATAGPRTARVLRTAAPAVLAGDPQTLVDLLHASALKLPEVRHIVLAWPEDLGSAERGALEALMGEMPKDAARTLITRALTPEIEELVERYARRARRELPAPPAGDAPKPAPMEFVSVHAGGRATAVRRLLDALDPAAGFVYTRAPESAAAAAELLDTLGCTAAGTVTHGEAMPRNVALLLLFDPPASGTELQGALNGHAAERIIALAEPRQVGALRELAGGFMTPFALPEAAARARRHEEKVRDALRGVLTRGEVSRELLTLEPLLAEYDGVEVAAAALRLLETERVRRAEAPPPGTGRMVRLFINAGETDGIRAGDLVGAIANLGGLTGKDVGRVELRDRHALVEVPEGAAEAIATKLTGVTIKGRQIVARIDQERPRAPRGTRPEPGGRGGPPRRPPKKWGDRDR